MATRSPADTSTQQFYGCDWYEPYNGWNCQKGTAAPKPLTSDQIYGHGGTDPYTATFPPA